MGQSQHEYERLSPDFPHLILSLIHIFIKRLPVRYTYDNNYFYDTYQGIPIGGYTGIFERMLEGIEVKLNIDFFAEREYYESLAEKIVFTGMIDEYFGYQFGKLEYRSLRFDNDVLDVPNYQGNAVVNYTEAKVPYTRIIEHKHLSLIHISKM